MPAGPWELLAVRAADFGERIPNFVRPAPDGTPVMFYDLCCGQAALLIVLGSDADTGDYERASRLIGAASPELRPIVLVPGGTALARKVFDRLPHSVVLADTDGAVCSFLLGRPAAASDAAGALTDRLLRLDMPAAPLGDISMPVRHGPESATGGDIISAAAPVLVVPRILCPAECDLLIETFERGDAAPSGMLRVQRDGEPALQEDLAAKSRRDLILRDRASTERIIGWLSRRLAPELRHAFDYRPAAFEAIKLVRYDAENGGHFAVHRDNITPDAANRRFALTLNLNTGAYEGGEIEFPEYGDQRFAPPAGGAIVFSCSLAHRVRPLIRGRRYALITFFSGRAGEAPDP